MKQLRSHPHLFLCEHIAQLRAASLAIWLGHSKALRDQCADIGDWIGESITFHDAGKGSAAFQGYIIAPDRYRGNKRLKAHTPLSTLCVLNHGREHGWPWPKLLAVASLACGHHSELKTEEGLAGAISNDGILDILENQVETLDWSALDAAIGLPITRIAGDSIQDLVSNADDQIRTLFAQLRDSPNLLGYRLKCQLAFSILLEADKAFLAVGEADIKRYTDRNATLLPAATVDAHLGKKKATAVDPLREQARAALLANLASPEAGRVQTMTLPTGLGKTLLGATWALIHRERSTQDGSPPSKIVIVLPFLSIVDQTVREYQDLLKDHIGQGTLSGYHSLSERVFDPELEQKSQEFFLDTWQSDVIVTTFDQFLLALFSPRAKHQIRFHNLADALIVLDEVQAFPCILWELMRVALSGLTELGNTRVLAMSATQPGFLPEAHETIPDPGAFFSRMARYRLVLGHQTPVGLSAFIETCRERLKGWKGWRVMITLNTRKSARRVFDALFRQARELGIPIHFITADRTPADRLAAITEIREGRPCLVVSTQCVEAGVDIDLDLIIRDFAPLDSLIQIAGRCNRHGARPVDTVEIVSLFDDDSSSDKNFGEMIYDPILLQETLYVLEGLDEIAEEEIYPLTLRYFDRLRGKKNLGQGVADDWINWRDFDPIRNLLRGEQAEQISFVVVDQDPDLRALLADALDLVDRWERKQAFRRLAPRMARVTVSVLNSKHSPLEPDDYAEPFPPESPRGYAWFWLLNPRYYDPKCGLRLGEEDEEKLGTVLI